MIFASDLHKEEQELVSFLNNAMTQFSALAPIRPPHIIKHSSAELYSLYRVLSLAMPCPMNKQQNHTAADSHAFTPQLFDLAQVYPSNHSTPH